MSSFFKKNKSALFCLFLIAVSFAAGIWVGRDSVKCRFCQPEEIDFSLFWEAYHQIQEDFVFTEKIDPQKILYGAISGMVKALDDPYTVFMDPEESKKFNEDVSGSFEGIGAEIGIRKDQLQIIAPLEGTPAQKAGLRAGDKILKINDTLASDLTIEEAVDLIRGAKGTEVTLTIFREEWNTAKEITIERGIILIPSLKWEMKNGNIAYLRLYQFSERAGVDFKESAIEILSSPAQKIVLDLRNNPGGYLEIAQEITGWFLKRGDIALIEDFGKEKEEYFSQGNERLADYPIVVLINEGSASGSEILAGALRDNRGVLLIGETSFGKGSVQELKELEGGSSLKITIARWLTPKGESISERGLDPDIRVEMAEEDYEQGRDPQLDKALEIIKNL